MILLDTDHLTVLGQLASLRRERLVARLDDAGDEELGTTIVNFEEQLRGWLASIAKERLVIRQVRPYAELTTLLEFFSDYHIAPFHEPAAKKFGEIQRIRIGTMDLKVAAIAITNNALLLTANRRDFEKVPGLRFENWLD